MLSITMYATGWPTERSWHMGVLFWYTTRSRAR